MWSPSQSGVRFIHTAKLNKVVNAADCLMSSGFMYAIFILFFLSQQIFSVSSSSSHDGVCGAG